ncbi:MAG TPA: hypothetical protein VLE93_02115 [Candidatus Saccharimonadales bacterium]|nr:hypothetical protein [Candidatus Saccharimonadales bacterium]
MKRITLGLQPRKSSGAGEVLLGLFGGTLSLQRIVLERAFKVFQPKALDFIWHIRESENLIAEPHQLWVDYQASFVDADFEVSDKLTLLGQYLKAFDGHLFNDSEVWDDVLRNMPDTPYWNPEWPMPARIKVGWEYSKPPYDLTVIYGADSDEQMAHLLTHHHLDDILNGMLPIIEEFLNRKVQEILKMDPSWFDEESEVLVED